jgi:transcriptional regulator with XRE-family HTH domain
MPNGSLHYLKHIVIISILEAGGEIFMIGERVKARRAEMGFTGKQLADKIGVTQPYISAIERGEREPAMEVLRSLALSLQTTTSYLLNETDDPSPSAFLRGVEGAINKSNVNTIAKGESSTAIGRVDGQNTIIMPSTKTNMMIEGEGIIFEFEPGKRFVFPKDTPQEVITATIAAVLKR